MSFLVDVTVNLPEVNMRMRTIVVLWMWEVSIRFNYTFATGWSAIEILDRYLMVARNATVKTLQCQGTAALVIAAKLQEHQTEGLSSYIHVAAESFSLRDLLDMEECILNALHLDLTLRVPMPSEKRLWPAAMIYTVYHCRRVDMDSHIAHIDENGLPKGCGSGLERVLSLMKKRLELP